MADIEIIREIVKSLGGSRPAAEAAGLNPRTVQRAVTGDYSPETARQIRRAWRPPLWGVERAGRVFRQENPRATVLQFLIFIAVAQEEGALLRDISERLTGDPESSAVYSGVDALLALGWIVDLPRISGEHHGGPPRRVLAMTLAGWRALGLGVDPE